MPQPILPPPVPLTDIERSYIEDSPGGFFPSNQDSNFGSYRKVVCDVFTDIYNQIQTMYNERFPDTASEFLNEWEEDLGIPINRPGKTVQQRRSILRAHLKRGAFTNSLRNAAIEEVLAPNYGPVAQFGTEGLNLQSGVPLFGPPGDIKQFYTVRENITNFSYLVLVDNRIGFDPNIMTSVLNRITPAGISWSYAVWYQKTGGAKSDAQAGGLSLRKNKTGGGFSNAQAGATKQMTISGKTGGGKSPTFAGGDAPLVPEENLPPSGTLRPGG